MLICRERDYALLKSSINANDPQSKAHSQRCVLEQKPSSSSSSASIEQPPSTQQRRRHTLLIKSVAAARCSKRPFRLSRITLHYTACTAHMSRSLKCSKSTIATFTSKRMSGDDCTTPRRSRKVRNFWRLAACPIVRRRRRIFSLFGCMRRPTRLVLG